MPIKLEEAYRILEICTYSESDYLGIIAQLTEIDKLDAFTQVFFSIKEMNSEKLFQLGGRMKHTQWADIHLEFCFFKPLKNGIQVYIINPDPQMLKFHIQYHQQVKDKILDFTQEFYQVKTLLDILLNLKVRFENIYPYSRIQHIQHTFQASIQSVGQPNIKPIQPNIQQNVQPNISDQTTQALKNSLKFITQAVYLFVILQIKTDWQSQEKIKQDLVKEYDHIQIERAELKQLLKEISDNSEDLKNETIVMNQFLSENSDVQIDENNILDALPMIPAQQQICELQAEILAIKDTYKFIQYKFQKQVIPLEYLYQNLKHLADLEFNSQLLLKKCQAKLSIK